MKSKNKITEYRFDVYQFGYIIETIFYTDYEKAKRHYLRNYYNYDYAEVLYVDGERVSFLDTYEFFNVAYEYSRNWFKYIMK